MATKYDYTFKDKEGNKHTFDLVLVAYVASNPSKGLLCVQAGGATIEVNVDAPAKVAGEIKQAKAAIHDQYQ